MTQTQTWNLCRALPVLALCFLASIGLIAPPIVAQQPAPPQDNRLLSHDSTQSSGERRIALVIGNGAYQNVKPLKNPPNDAILVTATLKKLGFEVTTGIDKSQREMKLLIREFGGQLRSGGVGLFYFAGHGVQSNGHNYLIPVEAEIQSDADLEDGAVDLNFVLNKMDDAKNALNIAILDACRTNPFASNLRSGQNGLAQIEAPSGTLVAYATAPGSTAADGSEANSPYTEELTRQMQSPGVFLETIFRRVAEKVSARTGGRQEPWFSANVKGDFYFSSASNGADTNGERPSGRDKQSIFDRDNQARRDKDWALVNTKSCAEIDLFLRSYHGDFEATLFQARLNCNGNSLASTTTKPSPDAEFYINRGLEHYQVKDYDQVIIDCTEAIKLDPNAAILYTFRGVAYFKSNDYALAIADLTKAIRLDPTDAITYKYRGKAYSNKKNYHQAMVDYGEAIRLDPKDASPYMFRGIAHYYQDDYEGAIADCTQAIAMNPKYDDAYFIRGTAQDKKGNYAKAIADFTTAINLEPKDPNYFLFRGIAYSNNDDHDNALADFTEAIRLGKKTGDAYVRRGTAYYYTKRYDEAIADYSEAIRLGERQTGFYRRGMSYYSKENYDQAIADFTELIKLDPKVAEAYVARGLSYYQKGTFELAVKDCDEAIKLAPNYKGAYDVRALAYDKLGETEKAEVDKQKAKDLQKQENKP